MGRYDLTDFEWRVIEPLMPMDRRGPKPQNNRQIINGMFYILRTGSPWRDLPERYGPYTTVYNRFNRWSRQGIWHAMFEALTGHSGLYGSVAIDATHIKAHRSAAGGKGGPSAKPSAARAAARLPSSTD